MKKIKMLEHAKGSDRKDGRAMPVKAYKKGEVYKVGDELAYGLAVADRIRRTVEDTLFEAGPESPFRLSISIGVATYPDHCQTRTEMLDLSDKAMYRAKSLGRNRVCSANDLVSGDPPGV